MDGVVVFKDNALVERMLVLDHLASMLSKDLKTVRSPSLTSSELRRPYSFRSEGILNPFATANVNQLSPRLFWCLVSTSRRSVRGAASDIMFGRSVQQISPLSHPPLPRKQHPPKAPKPVKKKSVKPSFPISPSLPRSKKKKNVKS